MKKIIIYGASHPDTVKVLGAINGINNQIIGFLDDVKYQKETHFMEIPIYNSLVEIHIRLFFCIPIGNVNSWDVPLYSL